MKNGIAWYLYIVEWIICTLSDSEALSNGGMKGVGRVHRFTNLLAKRILTQMYRTVWALSAGCSMFLGFDMHVITVLKGVMSARLAFSISDFKKENWTWTGIRIPDFQILCLVPYQLSYTGWIADIGVSISLERHCVVSSLVFQQVADIHRPQCLDSGIVFQERCLNLHQQLNQDSTIDRTPG